MKNSKSVQSFVSLCLSETNYDEEDYLYIDGHYVPIKKEEDSYEIFIVEKYDKRNITVETDKKSSTQENQM